MKTTAVTWSCAIAFVFLLPLYLQADVKIPAIFGDHMVLQQGADISIWGWAAPGETVMITAADQKAGTVAAADGKWLIHLGAQRAGGDSFDMIVTGNNRIVLHDVLIGDVWLASGQSNMEFPLKSELKGKTAVHQADHPKIRFFRVPFLLANDSQSDCEGKWELCTPESAADFSAVAYCFAVELQESRAMPVGIIGSYRGGSIAQGWTSIEGVRSQPALKALADDFDAARVKTAPLMVKYEQSLAKWNKAQKEWVEAVKAAEAEGKLPPPMPRGKRPESRVLDYRIASLMYNGMIAPIQPYAITGIIYYQGESDAHNMAEVQRYSAVFPNLIKNWRRIWGNEKLPFLFVQLPNYRKRQSEPGESVWAAMREVQEKALALPNTGMAVTIDLGDVDSPENIHPKNKVDVARRLSLVAQRVVYGKQVVDAGPSLQKMTIEGNKVRLKFESAAGLQAGPRKTTEPQPITGFAIAGADKQFVWADAELDPSGDVIVSSAKIAMPTAVRYGWADNPQVSLYNKEGLPVAPFRTDDWALSDPPQNK